MICEDFVFLNNTFEINGHTIMFKQDEKFWSCTVKAANQFNVYFLLSARVVFIGTKLPEIEMGLED